MFKDIEKALQPRYLDIKRFPVCEYVYNYDGLGSEEHRITLCSWTGLSWRMLDLLFILYWVSLNVWGIYSQHKHKIKEYCDTLKCNLAWFRQCFSLSTLDCLLLHYIILFYFITCLYHPDSTVWETSVLAPWWWITNNSL